MPPTLSLPAADRYISRHVSYRGRDMGLCTVSIGPDGRPVVSPFVAETPATVVIDRPICVADAPASHIKELITIL